MLAGRVDTPSKHQHQTASTVKRIRFLMIGGFLGAGKTTTIARLARHYMDEGLKVGLVTNDQAYNLVDTQSLRAQGFRVGEVPGACFCCKFDELVDVASRLAQEEFPDVIIVEPVGSCTDLVATVIEPLKHLHGEVYEVSPLAVLLKPEHGRKILQQGEGAGFSPKAAYIFLKQIEEADIVVLNKIDKLSEAQREELLELVRGRFAEKELLAVSARDGLGFDQLIEALGRARTSRGQPLQIDYDIYAEGEAELGWLNCTVRLAAQDEQRFSLDQLITDLVGRLRIALAAREVEPAHLKILGQSQTDFAIANLVGSAAEVELSLASHIQVSEAELIVNARVAADPELLCEVVQSEITSLASDRELSCKIEGMQHFRPGRPTPTHRMTGSEKVE